MKFRISIFIIATVIFFSACKDESNEPEPSTDWSDVEMVTGVQLTDFNGNLIGKVGNPNTKNEDFAIFPNPAVDVIFIQTRTALAELYILPASKNMEFSDENFEERFSGFQYSTDDIVEPTTQSLTFDSLVQNTQINISDFSTGYYRLFFREKQGGDFQWENLYIDNENPSSTMIDSLVIDWK